MKPTTTISRKKYLNFTDEEFNRIESCLEKYRKVTYDTASDADIICSLIESVIEDFGKE